MRKMKGNWIDDAILMAAPLNASTMSTNREADKSLLEPGEDIEGGLQDALYKQLLLQVK